MHKIDVLDKGYVQLEEWMCDEDKLVEILQICKGKSFTSEDKARLIKLIMHLDHTSVLEHIVFRFKVKCPIFVARQWFRHRIGSYTEMSYRVARSNLEFYVPEGLNDKQRYILEGSYAAAERYYQALLELNVRPELARIILPLALYTEFYWTVNLRSLLNFLKLRLHKSAQYEIRQYANAVLKLCELVVPTVVLESTGGERFADHIDAVPNGRECGESEAGGLGKTVDAVEGQSARDNCTPQNEDTAVCEIEPAERA